MIFGIAEYLGQHLSLDGTSNQIVHIYLYLRDSLHNKAVLIVTSVKTIQSLGIPGRCLDSRAKCNRALCEPDLHVFAKLFENCLKRSLEAKAFSGREIGGDDDVLDFLVGHLVDVDLTRQPAS